MAVGVQYYKVILRHTVRSQRNFRNFPTVIDRLQVASSNCTNCNRKISRTRNFYLEIHNKKTFYHGTTENVKAI